VVEGGINHNFFFLYFYKISSFCGFVRAKWSGFVFFLSCSFYSFYFIEYIGVDVICACMMRC
jgi:hypothetical protein